MFGRATITLCIGPHSSCDCFVHGIFLFRMDVCSCCVNNLVSSVQRQQTDLVVRPRNDLFCVEWDVKP